MSTDIRALAHECGAVSYTPGPMRAVRGVSMTFEQLEAFAARVLAQAAAPEPWLERALVVLGDIRKDVRSSDFGGLQCDELERQLRAAADVPEGCTPVDARVLREANHGLAVENHNLREAVQFYADKTHFSLADESAWDTVSGEPQNFWCDEAGTATVEDGTVAAMALAGKPLRHDDDPLSAAAHDVLAERERQVNAEGWTPAHDDEHVNDELAAMGCFYLMPAGARDWDASSTSYGATLGEAIRPIDWDAKTGDRRRELVKGTALGLAEIERLDRAAAREAAGGRDHG